MKLVRRLAYRTSMFVVTLALIVAIWELYKVIGPQDGGMFFGVRILPRANDTAMPHVSTMFSRYGRPEVRGSDKKSGSSFFREHGFHCDYRLSDFSRNDNRRWFGDSDGKVYHRSTRIVAVSGDVADGSIDRSCAIGRKLGRKT